VIASTFLIWIILTLKPYSLYSPFNPVIVDKCPQGLGCYITVFHKVLSIHLWVFFFVYPFMVFFFYYFGGIFEFIYFKKYHVFCVNYAYFYVLFLLH